MQLLQLVSLHLRLASIQSGSFSGACQSPQGSAGRLQNLIATVRIDILTLLNPPFPGQYFPMILFEHSLLF